MAMEKIISKVISNSIFIRDLISPHNLVTALIIEDKKIAIPMLSEL